jgi:hypothetical protein
MERFRVFMPGPLVPTSPVQFLRWRVLLRGSLVLMVERWVLLRRRLVMLWWIVGRVLLPCPRMLGGGRRGLMSQFVHRWRVSRSV